MSTNQILTHEKNILLDKYTKNQSIVLNAIRKGYGTINLINIYTNLPVKTISGRLSELTDLGKIKQSKTIDNQTFYIEVKCWYESQSIFRNRKRIKYEKWVKLGEKNNYIEKYLQNYEFNKNRL